MARQAVECGGGSRKIPPSMMVMGDLFSGIGGFSVGGHRAGWSTAFHCEINPWAREVLKYHFPKSKIYEDITTADFTIWRGKIDVLTGGFPCQPFSSAGKRKGTEDERHLWPAMLRAIREIQPRWVVGENVRGLINWDGGLVFDQVQIDLEAAGYEVIPFLLPACGINAPHRRDRVWFVSRFIADSGSDGRKRDQSHAQGFEGEPQGISLNELDPLCDGGAVANTRRKQLQRKQQHRSIGKKRSIKTESGQSRRPISSTWEKFPTQSPICGGNDGLPTELDGITFSKWRNESIKAYGNAIVPQVFQQIAEAINQYELQEA